MSVNLSPIGNGVTFLGNTGLPLAGGLLYTYQAGSSTPLATYTDSNGLVPNANPIVLGTDGKTPSEIWLTYGYNYKFILKDSAGNLINTYDNIAGPLTQIPAVASAFTTGMIMLWSGSIGSIPAGWYLCDGTNGTPNLKDSFIVGAGNIYPVGAANLVQEFYLPMPEAQIYQANNAIISGGQCSLGFAHIDQLSGQRYITRGTCIVACPFQIALRLLGRRELHVAKFRHGFCRVDGVPLILV